MHDLEDGMVDVRSKRCLHDSCTKLPKFNFEGSRTSTYCRQHAEDSMVDVNNKRCSYNSCTRRPSFNTQDRRTPVFCK